MDTVGYPYSLFLHPHGYVYSSTQRHRKALFFPAQIKEPAHIAPAQLGGEDAPNSESHREFAGKGEVFPSQPHGVDIIFLEQLPVWVRDGCLLILGPFGEKGFGAL